MTQEKIDALAFLNWLRTELEEALPGNHGYDFDKNQPELHSALQLVARAGVSIVERP